MPPSRRRRRQGAGRRRRQTPPTDRRARGFAEVPGPEPASGLRACAEALRGEPLTNRCARKARLRKMFPARAAQRVVAPSGLPTGAGEGPDAPPLKSWRAVEAAPDSDAPCPGRACPPRPSAADAAPDGAAAAWAASAGRGRLATCLSRSGLQTSHPSRLRSGHSGQGCASAAPNLARQSGWCPGRRPPHPALAFGAIHAGVVAAASQPGGTGPGPARSRLSRSVELPWAGWVCKERKHRSLPASPQIFRSSKDPFAVAIGT